MNHLKKINDGIEKVMYFLGGSFVLAITVVVFLQVLIRYVFRSSLGVLSDIPPYLNVFIIWISSIVAAKDDSHIKIQLLDGVIKNKTVLKWLDVVLKAAITVAMGMFAYYSWTYVISQFQSGGIDPGLHLPFWLLYSVLPVASTLMAMYYGINAVKKAIGGDKK